MRGSKKETRDRRDIRDIEDGARLGRSGALEKVLNFFFAENQGEFTTQGPLVLPRRRGMNQSSFDGLVEKYPQQGSRFEALVDQQPNAPLRNILDPGRVTDLLAGYSLPKCAHIGGIKTTCPYRSDRDSSSKWDKKMRFFPKFRISAEISMIFGTKTALPRRVNPGSRLRRHGLRGHRA